MVLLFQRSAKMGNLVYGCPYHSGTTTCMVHTSANRFTIFDLPKRKISCGSKWWMSKLESKNQDQQYKTQDIPGNV